MIPPLEDMPEAGALLASLVTVMTRHAETGCPRLAELVGRELQALVAVSADQPQLAAIARSLAERWTLIRAAGMPAGPTRH